MGTFFDKKKELGGIGYWKEVEILGGPGSVGL